MDELDILAAKLDKLAVDQQARIGYDLVAGGLVWSDEIPVWHEEAVRDDELPIMAGLGHFRALLNHRNALILGEPAECFQDLWDEFLRLCPNWPGFQPTRRDQALADEARTRSEAGIRSFEELDERYRQQQQAKASAANA